MNTLKELKILEGKLIVALVITIIVVSIAMIIISRVSDWREKRRSKK